MILFLFMCPFSVHLRRDRDQSPSFSDCEFLLDDQMLLALTIIAGLASTGPIKNIRTAKILERKQLQSSDSE